MADNSSLGAAKNSKYDIGVALMDGEGEKEK